MRQNTVMMLMRQKTVMTLARQKRVMVRSDERVTCDDKAAHENHKTKQKNEETRHNANRISCNNELIILNRTTTTKESTKKVITIPMMKM